MTKTAGWVKSRVIVILVLVGLVRRSLAFAPPRSWSGGVRRKSPSTVRSSTFSTPLRPSLSLLTLFHIAILPGKKAPIDLPNDRLIKEGGSPKRALIADPPTTPEVGGKSLPAPSLLPSPRRHQSLRHGERPDDKRPHSRRQALHRGPGSRQGRVQSHHRGAHRAQEEAPRL